MTTSQSTHVRVRINRACWISGKVAEIGSELSLPIPLAAELMTAGRVERADREPSPQHHYYAAEAKAKASRKADSLAAAQAAKAARKSPPVVAAAPAA